MADDSKYLRRIEASMRLDIDLYRGGNTGSRRSSPDSKVLFRVPEDDGSTQVETLWATSLGNDEYRLDNAPFYAYSVSLEDLVAAPFDLPKTVRRFGES